MKSWSELLDALMLGIQHSPMPPETFAGHTPEQTLLKQIALIGAYRRAGYVANTVKIPPQIDPAPPENLPACSIHAIDWLRRVAETAYTRDLALDWFLYIHKRGKRVPHTTLPYVLNLAVKYEAWIPYIIPVLGERGRWMVERNKVYRTLQQPELRNHQPRLRAAKIDPKNKSLIDLHKEMMEGLAHE